MISPKLGYKEFEPYLATRSRTDAINARDPTFLACLDRMKISTRQYAKSQIRWIKVKLLPAIEKAPTKDVTIYLLDATGKLSLLAFGRTVIDRDETEQIWRIGIKLCEIQRFNYLQVRIIPNSHSHRLLNHLDHRLAFLNKETLPDPASLSNYAAEQLSFSSPAYVDFPSYYRFLPSFLRLTTFDEHTL